MINTKDRNEQTNFKRMSILRDRKNWIFTKKRVETLAKSMNASEERLRRLLSSHRALLYYIQSNLGHDLQYGWNCIEVLSSGRCPVGIAVFKEKDGSLSIPIKNTLIERGRLYCYPKDKKVRGACIKMDSKYTESEFRTYHKAKISVNSRILNTIDKYYTTDKYINGKKYVYSFVYTLVAGIMD